ncbi:MAG: site-specific DNA-methyltransferase [Exiguobacterium sp.]|nr:site-specific DNA-methyltransferase [Exiguobacterium sp.]
MKDKKSFYEEVIEVLKKDKRFVSEKGEILRNAVIEAAQKMDAKLLKALRSNVTTRKRFFTDIDGIAVFDKQQFGWVVSNRAFLPDSYTRFRNKIGLAVGDDMIASSRNVELVFPYKDCVLEGGQTKEDQKRDEIFYNATLAPDEVDRLLAPKVLMKAVRYDKKGKKAAVAFDRDKDNLVIKGNNLSSLASLLQEYEGRVNLIYIDPPFNTEKDSFSYNDNFSRSTWLVFMRNRLELAKRLLCAEGNIFIHIDINQSHYLKVLCDEVFHEDNFVEEIIWAYGSPSGGRAATPKPVNIHDYLLHYAKRYAARKQHRVYIPYTQKYINDWFKFTDEDGRRYQRRQRGRNEKGEVIWERQYLDESKGFPLSTVWSDIQQVYADPRAYKDGAKADVEVIKSFKGGQKPEALIKRLIDMTTDPGDLILDYHAGTGTTGATALKMGRKFILCEQMESQIAIIKSRLEKVIGGDTAGVSKLVNWKGGGSFVYCELSKSNQQFADRIEAAKKELELEKIWDEMLATGFISCKIDPSAFSMMDEDFKALSLKDKKRILMDLLDMNQLYVNYCDIDDKTFRVSAADKAFTKSFYGDK